MPNQRNTWEVTWLLFPIMFAIMLALEELGEKPSHGGTNISFVHWRGIKLRLSLSHQPVPSDHHLIIKPCSEKATSPCRWKHESDNNQNNILYTHKGRGKLAKNSFRNTSLIKSQREMTHKKYMVIHKVHLEWGCIFVSNQLFHHTMTSQISSESAKNWSGAPHIFQKTWFC